MSDKKTVLTLGHALHQAQLLDSQTHGLGSALEKLISELVSGDGRKIPPLSEEGAARETSGILPSTNHHLDASLEQVGKCYNSIKTLRELLLPPDDE